MADELDSGDRKIGALSLMKVLANFIYDFPSKPPLFDRIHRLIREPDMHGTVVKAFHPIRAPSPIPIYRSERLGNRYIVESEEAEKGEPRRGLKRVWFSARPDALKDLHLFYDNSQQVTLDEIIAYISFLTQLEKRTGSTDILTALSICRTPESFYWHIHKNLTLWSEAYNEFLDNLNFPYEEDTREGPLHHSGEASWAGLKKIDLWTHFDRYIREIKQKMREARFKTPQRKVLGNIDTKRHLPIVKDVTRILSIQRALTGVTLAKLFPERKRRTPREIERWAFFQFQRHNFTFDINSLSKANDAESIRKILEAAYFEICYLIENLPDPKPESEEDRNKALYLSMAYNRAATVCQQAGWSCPSFVHWDLTGSRDLGKIAVPRTATLYEESDRVTEKFGGKCITLRPDGNDCLLYVFGRPVAALRAAAHSMACFSNSNIAVKGGMSHVLVEPVREYSVLIPTMGLAKDLCELKKPVFRNRNDILLSSELVDYLEEGGISRNYFVEVGDIAIDHKVGKETKTLKVFKLDWQRFCRDNR